MKPVSAIENIPYKRQVIRHSFERNAANILLSRMLSSMPFLDFSLAITPLLPSLSIRCCLSSDERESETTISLDGIKTAVSIIPRTNPNAVTSIGKSAGKVEKMFPREKVSGNCSPGKARNPPKLGPMMKPT